MGLSEAAGRLRLDCVMDSSVAVVTVTGEIDVSTSALLREHLLRVITDEPHRSLVVHLAQVSFIDSTGTGVCVDTRRPATARARSQSRKLAFGRLARLLPPSAWIGSVWARIFCWPDPLDCRSV